MTAAAAILLAVKLDEAPKRAREVALMLCPMLGYKGVSEQSERCSSIKVEIQAYERILLHTLQFELAVEVPYGVVSHICPKRVQPAGSSGAFAAAASSLAAAPKRADSSEADRVKKVAFTLAYSAQATLCTVRFTSDTIGYAAVLAACALCEVQTPPDVDSAIQRAGVADGVHSVLLTLLNIVHFNNVPMQSSARKPVVQSATSAAT